MKSAAAWVRPNASRNRRASIVADVRNLDGRKGSKVGEVRESEMEK